MPAVDTCIRRYSVLQLYSCIIFIFSMQEIRSPGDESFINKQTVLRSEFKFGNDCKSMFVFGTSIPKLNLVGTEPVLLLIRQSIEIWYNMAPGTGW